jgi:hypothetical protein
MEINEFEEVIGVVVQQDITEGRFITLTSNVLGGSFMNTDSDLPGAILPATAEQAKRAVFCVTFAVDNRQAPIIDYPHTVFDFRGGWVNSAAGPLTGLKMWLTPPGNQNGQTIPSGYRALGFTEGTFTIPSGGYIYNAALTVPGAALIVADVASDSASDAGKLKYVAAEAVGVVAHTRSYESSTGRLTVIVD